MVPFTSKDRACHRGHRAIRVPDHDLDPLSVECTCAGRARSESVVLVDSSTKHPIALPFRQAGSVCRDAVESGGDAFATSRRGAAGLMPLIPGIRVSSALATVSVRLILAATSWRAAYFKEMGDRFG